MAQLGPLQFVRRAVYSPETQGRPSACADEFTVPDFNETVLAGKLFIEGSQVDFTLAERVRLRLALSA